MSITNRILKPTARPITVVLLIELLVTTVFSFVARAFPGPVVLGLFAGALLDMAVPDEEAELPLWSDGVDEGLVPMADVDVVVDTDFVAEVGESESNDEGIGEPGSAMT